MKSILKKQIHKAWAVLFIILAVFCLVPFFRVRADELVHGSEAGKRNPESYWSVSNAPVFYGATKITLEVDAIDQFDPKDTRFRIFARDFEDGDLTPAITVTGEVNPHRIGTYDLKYRISDSHNNITTLTVPVTVRGHSVADGTPSEPIVVERTLYTLPSMWNMSLAGFSRCNSGDRQILGVYVPAGRSLKARILSSDNNIAVGFMANDSHKETGATLPQNGDWVTLSNVRDGVEYGAAVPVLTSSALAKGEKLVDKTFKIELAYAADIPPLDYYHYGDDEAAFRSKWTASHSTYGVIDGETVMVVVPLDDLPKTTNYYRSSFTSLDQFLNYYKQVVDKMDEYVGLDLNPEKITDQNVRTKYLVKANAHGAGAAYYAGNHVGVNSPSVASFFEMNWGGLHELAHGYQGSLGKGQMGLGEVGNNILGHYIQIDKSIYFHAGDWMGDPEKNEDGRNAARESGTPYNGISVGDRLYMIVNLFDVFEGGTTYGKIFSWYRERLNNGTLMVNPNANQDIYILALAEIYGVDATPYLEAWGLEISEPVKDEMRAHNYEQLTILRDAASDESVGKVMAGEGLKRKYTPIRSSLYQKYNITGNLNLRFQIDQPDKLIGRSLKIKDGTKVIRTVPITSTNLHIADLPVGAYSLEMPVIEGYFQGYASVSLKEGETTTYDYAYTPYNQVHYDSTTYIQVLGNTFDTIAYQLTFSSDFRSATISYPNQSAMAGNEAVRIYDASGKLISEDVATGGYFNFNQGAHELTLTPGAVIEITYPGKYANKVRVYNTFTPGQMIAAYRPTAATVRYIVTDNGLKLEGMTDAELENLNYSLLRAKLISIIEAYQKVATDEELAVRSRNFKTKADVLAAYEHLRPNDQAPYAEFIARILAGKADGPDSGNDNPANPENPNQPTAPSETPGNNDGNHTNAPGVQPPSAGSSDRPGSLPTTGPASDQLRTTEQTWLPIAIGSLLIAIVLGFSIALHHDR